MMELETVTIKEEIQDIQEDPENGTEEIPGQDICVKQETLEPTVIIKLEPWTGDSEDQNDEQQSVDFKTEVFIKADPDRVSDAASAADLYSGHEVKQDLVIGIEGVQPTQTGAQDLLVKYEPPASSSSEQTEAVRKGSKPTSKRKKITKRTQKKAEPSDDVTQYGVNTSYKEKKRQDMAGSSRIKRTSTNEGKPKTEGQISTEPTELKPCNGKETYICHYCDKVFTKKPLLVTHINNHQRRSIQPFYCKICKTNFWNKTYQSLHSRDHTKDKPYGCDVCQKSFSLLLTLRRHQRIHTGEKPYSCQICQKSFICTSSLNKHIRIHSDSKPHRCAECGKQFKQKSQLAIHSLIHKGEVAKRYACKQCPKKFMFRYKLTGHERIHLNRK